MAFIVADLSIELIETLRPLVPRIKARDKSLADQIQRAASSIALGSWKPARTLPHRSRQRRRDASRCAHGGGVGNHHAGRRRASRGIARSDLADTLEADSRLSARRRLRLGQRLFELGESPSVIIKTEIARFDRLFQRADFCGDSRVSGNHLTFERVEALIDTSVHASEKPPHVLERRILIRHDSATSLASIGLSRTARAVPEASWQNCAAFATIAAVRQRRLADRPPHQCAARGWVALLLAQRGRRGARVAQAHNRHALEAQP
jgi:hypothetical protein